MAIEMLPPTLQVYLNDPPGKLGALGTFDNGQAWDLTEVAVWSTENAQIAKVSNVAGNKGAVTGLKLGTTTVRATAGTVSGSMTLTVASHN